MNLVDSRAFRIMSGLISALTLVIVWVAFTAYGQDHIRMPMPHDWSHHHVVFTAPTSIAQAWKFQQEPRFLQQVLRKNAGGLHADHSKGPKANKNHGKTTDAFARDWGESLIGKGTTGAGEYPAKFTFDVNAAPDCTNDFVVFNTSLGGAANRATIIAFNHIYSTQGGNCLGLAANGTGPQTMWAYNTGAGSIVTSTVLSLDGTKVAMVATAGAGAILHILKWKAGEGTISIPATPTTTLTAGQNWTACPAANSCMSSIAFSGAKQDTNSPPFYNYSTDELYVGDDQGSLHKFTGVFNGAPAEVTGGWPIVVDSTHALTGPIFDSGSGNIYVADDAGKLSYVRDTASTVGSCGVSVPPCLGATILNVVGGHPILDAPIVDSSTHQVFIFAGNDGTNAVAVQAPTTLASSVKVIMGIQDAQPTYAGAFDNAYFTSLATGHLYACGKNASKVATLYRIGFNSSGVMNGTTDGNSFTLAGGAAACSPLTEIFNSGTSKEWLFLSVANQSLNPGACTGTAGCIMSFDITSAFPSAVSNAVNAASGTGGIVVDNVSTSTQASSIYFSTQANTTCNGVGGLGCAIKLTQSGLQ